MILHGKTDGKKIVASLSRHHYVSHGKLMMDGGQCLTNHYAGYSRYSMDGDLVWFEVPETFDELYNARHDGVWDVENVRIISKEEYEKIDTLQEKANNFIWGTKGKNGDEPFRQVSLKNCSKEHLEAIIKNVPHIHEETEQVIKYLISQKSNEQ
jgi:hypothetical protein